MTRAESFIREALSRGELGHAYLVESPRPGKANQVIRQLAALIACEKGTACGGCASCRAFATGNHPDIISLRKDKNAYGVREIREQLVEDIGIRPYRFERKIYLIPDGETLSPLCQNVMLKTLEEPPSYGVILLATLNRQVFLPTVLSRLVCLPAQEEGKGDEAREEGRAMEALPDFFRNLPRARAADCLKIHSRLKKEGLTAPEQLQGWEQILRDIYAVKGGAPGQLIYPACEASYREYAERLSDTQMMELWEACRQAKDRLGANIPGDSVIGSFCLALRDALLEREE